MPRNSKILYKLVNYLNSNEIKEWLKLHCQRAANGYLRLQSHVIKKIHIPDDIFLEAMQEDKGRLEPWIKVKKLS